jgi:hypothetical protein
MLSGQSEFSEKRASKTEVKESKVYAAYPTEWRPESKEPKEDRDRIPWFEDRHRSHRVSMDSGYYRTSKWKETIILCMTSIMLSESRTIQS